MRITPYNQQEAIEMLLGRTLLFFMGEHDKPLDELGEHGAALWDLCSGMSTEDAALAIKHFEATQ